MNIDEHISIIMQKIKELSKKNPEDTCGEFPPKWNPPLEKDEVERFERQNKIVLPEDYKRFITTVASSGTQPFYGLYNPVKKLSKHDLKADLNKKFPYTVRKPLDVYALSDEEYKHIYSNESDVDSGYIVLCTEGCAMYSILIINTDDSETYGTVWYYDLANDAGIFPLINPLTQKTMSFLDWLEYYVDKTLELDDTDYFSYGELSGRLE